MKEIVPDYYPLFRCKAGACRHSCCIGWEIEIDAETHQCYRNIPGAFGERLRSAIDTADEPPSFRLDERERCPFLNREGLCDIICTLGDDALCEICSEHPRFRAFYTDRTEIGVGLACEAAAALILGKREKVQWIPLRDDGTKEELTEDERIFFRRRQELLELVQDRTKPVAVRMESLLEEANMRLPEPIEEWIRLLSTLEQMDAHWGEILNRALSSDEGECPYDEIMKEQLLVYFLYRHLPDAEDEADFRARIAFSVLSVQLICTLAARVPEEDPEEIARLYSAEVEYSLENTGILLDEITYRNT